MRYTTFFISECDESEAGSYEREAEAAKDFFFDSAIGAKFGGAVKRKGDVEMTAKWSDGELRWGLTAPISTEWSGANRAQVYNVIDAEVDYQGVQEVNPDRPDVVPDLSLGDSLQAIEHNLRCAQAEWYAGVDPYVSAMHYLRKVAALCVKAGGKYGMPEREVADDGA